MADLLFNLPPGGKDLVLGEFENVPDVEGHVVGLLPSLVGPVLAGRLFQATVEGSLPGFGGVVQVVYKSMTDRPLVSRTVAQHQDAKPARTGASARHQDGQIVEAGPGTSWGAAEGLQQATTGSYEDAQHGIGPAVSARHQDAVKCQPPAVAARHQDALRDRRQSRRVVFQQGKPAGSSRNNGWQDRYRDRRPRLAVPWGRASRLFKRWGDAYGAAVGLDTSVAGRYQEAMRPPPGAYVPQPPTPTPCYLPDPHLVFFDTVAGPALLFRCDYGSGSGNETVTVPIRRVYVTVNSASLTRVSGGIAIPTYSMTLSLDVDSWTWSFSASVPGSALTSLMPSGPGDPVEVEAIINSVPYRFVIESLAWERVFGRSSVRVGGRGKAALLDDPYAPKLSFGNTTALTAAQLAESVLTFNSVPIGWGVDWGIDDWSVPGNTWTHQGTYISALNAIATATGAYVQPHDTDEVLKFLLRYPVPAWEWGSVTPDFSLPASVVSVESINFFEKPNYNRVYVTGQANGKFGRYTRAGSAGDLVAPTIVDSLITAAEPVRNRGRAVVSDTGPMATVNLRLPVLALTGIIKPGNFVEYDDGSTTRIGLTRAVSVSVDMPKIYQTITVETHV